MRFFVNTYIALFILYYLQGILYVQGGILSRLLLVGVLAISVYYFFYANIHFKLPTPMRILTIMIMIWTVYGSIPILFGVGNLNKTAQPFDYLKPIYISLLPIYAFYVFVKKEWLTENMIKKWFFVFLAVAIVEFNNTKNRELIQAIEKGSSREEFTNNAGYIVLSVLPLLALFQKKSLIQFVLLGIVFLYVLLGFKRGAIIACAISSSWLVFQSLKVEKANGLGSKKKIKRQLLTIIFIICAVFAVRYLMLASDFFKYRYESTISGDSSGRDKLYSDFINHFISETNFLVLLFGNGAFGTIKIGENYAHNDWLEIAIDNGLVFVIIYAIYWISLFKYLLKARQGIPATLMLGTFIIIYFSKTLFSMSYNDIFPYAACAVGYAFANYESKFSAPTTLSGSQLKYDN